MRPRVPAVAGFAIPFVLVVGLALQAGGYHLVPRSQVGIIAWWVILVGVSAGLLPLIRITRSGWIMLGLLAALAVWTGLAALTWTESTERSVIEFSRAITMLGFLGALLFLQGKEGMRRSIAGLGAATAVIAVIALASRYHPGWFDLGEMPENYPVARLNYPLGYWNGLASLMVVGLPALVWGGFESRKMLVRAASSGAIPLLILVVYMTASRGGFVALALTVLVLMVLCPGRIRLAVSLVLPALGSVILIALVISRPELRDNLGGPAGAQGVAMTWLTGLVVVLVAAGSWLVQARVLGRWIDLPEPSREWTRRLGLALGVALAGLILAGVASGFVADRWNDFKQPVAETATVDRLSSLGSRERYDNWGSAVEAGKASPITGIGPGAFEYWWSRSGKGPGFVRDAHSFYLEGFAELGIPGLLLALSLVLTPIFLAAKGAMRSALDERRPMFAAAAAGMTAFAVGAGIDWSWEMTVLPAAFLAYVAAVAGPDAETRKGRRYGPTFKAPLLGPSRFGIATGSVLAIAVIAVPMVGTMLVSSSQSSFRAGDVTGSLDKAKSARTVNPWSGSAAIQEALLESEIGEAGRALAAARDATDLDPYSWQAWRVLALLAAGAGQEVVEREAEARAVELNYKLRSVQKP